MDGGDVRAGGKKKRTKPVEIGFDSDDDEPIGSIFKLRRPRGSKKKVGSAASEGSCGDGGKNADTVARNSVDVEEDLGGMDDTLASFRKRLKGSGATRASCSALNLEMESSDKSHDASVEGIEVLAVSDDDVVARGSGSTSKDEKGVGLLLGDGMQHSSNEHMEDSLSEIFRKAQSNLVRKPRASSGSKKKKESQNGDNGLRPASEGVQETVDSLGESRPRSASKLVRWNLKSTDALSPASDLCPFSSVSVMDNQKHGDVCIQEEILEGICDSNISDGPVVDHSLPIDGCNEDRQQLSCFQSKDICAASDQKVSLQERILNDGLKQCSAMLHDVEMIDNASLSKAGKGICGFTEVELKNKLTDELAQECNYASEHGLSTSMEKENFLPSCDTEPLIKSTENILNENDYMVPGKVFSGCCVEVDEGVKSETEVVSGRHCCDYSGLDIKAEGKDLVLGISLEKNDAIASGSLSPKMSMEANEYELDDQSNHPEKPLRMCNSPKDSTASILKCSSVLDPIQSDGSSLPSAPDENENNAEYNDSVSDFANKDGKILVIPRVRQVKMRKHGDMTYEGDADWENLTNDQALNESHVVEDSEGVAVVAVSAGLKAHAAGPMEKIKFKEILKRKGGLKEYLACR